MTRMETIYDEESSSGEYWGSTPYAVLDDMRVAIKKNKTCITKDINQLYLFELVVYRYRVVRCEPRVQ